MFSVLQTMYEIVIKILFPDEHLVQVICDMFGAGTDATSNTLVWAILHLILDPNMQQKVTYCCIIKLISFFIGGGGGGGKFTKRCKIIHHMNMIVTY